ncbi:class I SAM-dependent methyltransferase [Nocardia sp. NPDC051321]|uniref:class I SAM-dependent methyltransferase n=1 Tax=Nocardia sp. NPDC051321 TaxID=3364323 RepID=UPI0037BBDBF6
MSERSAAMDPASADLSRRRRHLYDSTAGLYTATFHLIWRFGFPGLHTWLSDSVRDRAAVLDAGAAAGYWSRFIARTETRPRVVAMDFSQAYVLRAKQYLAEECGVLVLQGDITAAPFRSGSFDAVLCSGVLDTMPDPVPALAELRRLLRPDGKLLLILRGPGSRLSPLIERVFRVSISVVKSVTRSRGEGLDPELWSRTPIGSRLVDLATAAGLAVEDVRYGRILTRATLVASETDGPAT